MKKTFKITATMEERWIPYFLSMLKTMQKQGDNGHSGIVGIYADGDGDFRPIFEFSENFDEVKPYKNDYELVLYDAG